MNVALWGVLPYVTLLLLIGGTIWRYRYDKFGWTTRSSELYESRLLRIGSPLFHFGILVVIIGHAMGLVIPESWTEAIGVSEHLYHVVAAGFGLIAGVATLGGIAILIYRRRRTGPVFMATTANDKLMYVVLTGALVLGVYITLIGTLPDAEGVNYRETVSPWFRSIFVLQPDVDAMAAAPLRFHIHVLVGMLVFAMVPFTRLVHAFTAPVHYLFRPYIVYRSRDVAQSPGSRSYRPGWAPVGTKDRQR
ncbi:respiratory nitrate reductase subunit gamma [Gordonia sp. Z-3]|uniref:Nitrate reductase-like protein NarX n=2 Tax=Gordonia TaxID=2053 RepID=A0A9X3I464_9ACTN|nr:MULTISPECIES: respiratory nitrate reductase subunit gamma [Gordonia]MAU84441.1 respiratory nitrate reductase subunit gamma [Gordonia sp. (in: high G+C Gram-positive bacteria)]MCF3940220.1 respiratory nitrate reductase subunit gamma [Gordonia tangerina]MCX2964407.1 respiratory nitrate reductase subunit gamma [Gordonia aquimaris]MED5799524.1 respiratory nitrate reductase subunit gamma [Gordonia sp. Z-3]